MSYVQLKHTLAGIAHEAIEHPGRAKIAGVLSTYARMTNGGPVPVAELARAAGMPSEGLRRLLLPTGLFFETVSEQGRAFVLRPPFLPHAAYFRRQTGRLVETLRLLGAPAPPGVSAEIWRGTALFNAGLFFEAHELFEGVWRGAGPADRAFYHGLIQAAAGCYHLEKGNLRGARTLVAKALAKLRLYPPAHLGVDVAALLAGLAALLCMADAVPPRLPASRLDLPVITMAPDPGAAGRAGTRRPT